MRLGLLGGTFDPIHLGHLRAAESARETLGLELVLFVPARLPPHRAGPVSPALDRFAMVALATAGHPAFRVSDLELVREGPSYTVDTLRALKREWPQDELYLIVGSDTCAEVASWREPDEIRRLCRLAVVARPGTEAEASPPAVRVPGPALPISATELRRRAGEGLSLRYLVPAAVADYIEKRGLYR